MITSFNIFVTGGGGFLAPYEYKTYKLMDTWVDTIIMISYDNDDEIMIVTMVMMIMMTRPWWWWWWGWWWWWWWWWLYVWSNVRVGRNMFKPQHEDWREPDTSGTNMDPNMEQHEPENQFAFMWLFVSWGQGLALVYLPALGTRIQTSTVSDKRGLQSPIAYTCP